MSLAIFQGQKPLYYVGTMADAIKELAECQLFTPRTHALCLAVEGHKHWKVLEIKDGQALVEARHHRKWVRLVH